MHPLGGCYWFCTAVILSAVVSHVAVTHHAALARTRVHAPNLEKEEETKLSHTREWKVSETACEGRPVVRFLVYSGLTICAALTVVGSVSPWAAAEYRLPVFNDDTKLGVRDKWVVLIEDFAARGHGHGHGHGHDATTKASVEAMVTLLEAGGALPDVPVLLPKSWSPVQAAWELANLPAEVDGTRSNERRGFPERVLPGRPMVSLFSFHDCDGGRAYCSNRGALAGLDVHVVRSEGSRHFGIVRRRLWPRVRRGGDVTRADCALREDGGSVRVAE